MKLSIETAEAFLRDTQAKVDAAKAAGESTVEIELSARDAAIDALSEAQSLIDTDASAG